MLSIVLSNRFKKDLKHAPKRRLDLALLEKAVDSNLASVSYNASKLTIPNTFNIKQTYRCNSKPAFAE